MARVPYEGGVPTAQPDTRVPDDYQHIQVSPEMFGEAKARGLEKLGQGLQQASAHAFDTARFYADTAANDQTNQLIDAGTQLETKLRSMRGADAANAWPGLQKEYDDLIKQGRDNLPSPYAQLQYDRDSRRQRAITLSRMGSYVDEQQRSYQFDSWTKTSQNKLDGASQLGAQDPTNLDRLKELTAENINARVNAYKAEKGTPTPEAEQDLIAQGKRDAVQKYLIGRATKDASGALDFLEAHKSDVGENYPTLYDHIKAKRDEQLGERKGLEQLHGGAASGPMTAARVSGAILGQESGGNPNVRDSPDHAVGIGQIMPGTFAQYAKPGENIRNPKDNLAVHQRIIADYYQRYNGDPRRIAVAYFSGPGNVAGPESPTPWIRNIRDQGGKGTSTASYVASVMGRLGGGSPTGTPSMIVGEQPSTPTGNRADLRRALLDDPELQNNPKAMRVALGVVNEYTEKQDSERRTVDHLIKDDEKSILATGTPAAGLSQERVAAALGPAAAAEFAQRREIAQDYWKQTSDWATLSPDGIMQRLAELQPTPGQDNFAYREQLYNHAVTAAMGPKGIIQARWGDPAAYADQAPSMLAAHQQMQQGAPGGGPSFADLARTRMAVQSGMGIPPEAQRVMTNAEASRVADGIVSSPNPGKTMDELQRSMGDLWPKAFHELVSAGKLPMGYQAVQALDNEQDKALLARALRDGRPGKEGQPPKDWNEVLGDEGGKPVAHTIKTAIDTDMTNVKPLERSLSDSGATRDQIAEVKSSITTLAYAYKFYQNMDAATAADKAIKAFTSKYEYMPNGTARVPTAVFPAVSANARAMLDGLKEEQVAFPKEFAGSEADKRRYLDLLRAAPSWVTAPDATSIILQDNDGRTVRGPNNVPLAVPFSAPMPAGAGATTPLWESRGG
jgi:hypothetical protein